jgi:phosphatidylserine decarboxylase
LGATNADVSVCRLTLVRALLKEAMDAVVLNQRTRLLHSGEHRPYWTASVGATDVRAILDGRVC